MELLSYKRIVLDVENNCIYLYLFIFIYLYLSVLSVAVGDEHLCFLPCSFAYSHVLLFLSNKRKLKKLFFFPLKIAPEVSLCPIFTPDSAPGAFEAFPWLSLWGVTTARGKGNSISNTFVCKLEIALGASHGLNHGINIII